MFKIQEYSLIMKLNKQSLVHAHDICKPPLRPPDKVIDLKYIVLIKNEKMFKKLLLETVEMIRYM